MKKTGIASHNSDRLPGELACAGGILVREQLQTECTTATSAESGYSTRVDLVPVTL